MVSACTSEIDAKTREPPSDKALHMRADKAHAPGDEFLHLAFFLQEIYDRSVKSAEVLVLRITPRIVHASAIEDKASAISAPR